MGKESWHDLPLEEKRVFPEEKFTGVPLTLQICLWIWAPSLTGNKCCGHRFPQVCLSIYLVTSKACALNLAPEQKLKNASKIMSSPKFPELFKDNLGEAEVVTMFF
jgi:hypothetical protein